MLSILIPTYNYCTLPLVEELWKQATDAGIVFEIIVLDDGSNDNISLVENSKINAISNCRFEINPKNLSRAKTRNLLAEKSQYDWLLFMDCDTFPRNNSFITNYIKAIHDNTINVCYGGIAYSKFKPAKKNLLRWKYGSKREEIKVACRTQNPYATTLTSNILIQKDIFNSIKFDERIAEYGYEDLVFIQQLKEKEIQIKHIDNVTYHLNYETSKEFLSKTKKALETLKFIEEHQVLNSIETKIQKTYQLISKPKLNNLLTFLFKKMQTRAEKNLLSGNPSLFVFDLYKLGYFCFIKTS